MKNYLHCFLLTGVLLSVAGLQAYAQESGSPSFESYDTEHLRDRDRIPSTPGESPDPERPTNVKDSTAAKIPQRNVYKPSPVVPKDQSKPKNQTDDSILSFNFLYYLIQKYKMQDILD